MLASMLGLLGLIVISYAAIWGFALLCEKLS